ncbi:MAG: hypothetical protein IJR63_09410 [Synergistaceae bacterium]|nr:hypothetical protein [Synergistaceae bacterium]
MRKLLAALAILGGLAVSAYASEGISVDVPTPGISEYIIQRDMGSSIGFRTDDGLTVLYLGTFRAKQPEPSPESPDAEVKPDEGIFSVFMVRSDRDTALKLDVLEGVDAHTNKFSYRSGDWGYISDIMTNGNSRNISAGFWVRATLWHVLPFKYGDRPLISRIGFVINGYSINLKRIRPASWGDWVYVEREYAVPLEEDRKRIEFEVFDVRPEK